MPVRGAEKRRGVMGQAQANEERKIKVTMREDEKRRGERDVSM